MKNNALSSVRWVRLIPIVFFTYSLAYLDRANYSFGAASGMAHDLNITASMSSLLGALFFLGYFFFQVPSAGYAEKRSAKKLVFWSLITWGFLASLIGVVTNIYMLLVVRFLLGIVEAAIMPAMLIFLSHWFTSEERSRANTFLILGNPITVLWMSVVSGYLLNSFGWRWMFIIEGLPSILWAFIWWKLVDDKPDEAKWLEQHEKKALDDALANEQKGFKSVPNYREAFKQKSVVYLCLQYFFWSIGVYGFVMWLPSIIKSAPNISIVETGWLSSAPYLLAAILMVVASYFSDKLLTRKLFVWPFLLVGGLAFYASYLVGPSHFWISFTLMVIAGGAMYAPYGPFFAIVPELLPRNVAGGAMALINSMGALGSFVGAYFVGFLNGTTGGFSASYIFMAVSLVLAVIFTIIVKGTKTSLSTDDDPIDVNKQVIVGK
ncbi:MFS transporter [Sporolactobacillus laevolacticus]|uniref:MFS transporter n=1 Tax=Sporolactobacillus laevolacticus DSM 442 TaxID=1395513 RepID=V6IVL6_9BACL|nr:MFS transporter [Sporolactobacillus laevolacticus]EST11160.1 MFS transporter [Sporolactobacillus laevolacticus DSM 442]MDN3956622.1 MFS transporter [Sporolactobacillus laevolacticus]